MDTHRENQGSEPAMTRQELEAAIARLAEKREQCEAEARRYLERETTGQGVFAAEIFELKQKKQVLATEIRHLQVKLNHLLLSWE